jgi:transposase InsO family protein
MTTVPSLLPTKVAQRVAAVLDLFRGIPLPQVTAQHGICRSDLYKFRRRALTALHQALEDQPRGPKQPHNRLDRDTERQIASVCQRHPTWSASQVQQRCGPEAPCPRTIQRVRQRLTLPRVPKRAAPCRQAKRLPAETKQVIRDAIEHTPSLGSERLAWDLQNQHHLQISPSTVKRLKRALHDEQCPPVAPAVWRFYERHHPHSLWHGDFLEKVTLTDVDRTAYHFALLDDYSRGYVFCDLFLAPDQRTTITALITAMRQWQVIPNAVVFDNGSAFKGKLLSAFCTNLGVRLIHTSVCHPQTNGKLERAFRDDMRDFYQHYDTWLLEPLRRDLPAYVQYRNEVRGHWALRGQPAITRLREQHRMAVPWVLEGLESYACYEVGRKVLPPSGCIRLFNRDAYLDVALGGVEVTFCETLEGLEARVASQCVAILRGYRDMRQLSSWEWSQLPPVLCFETQAKILCPRIAVA